MHASIEQLIELRDGEPVDATARLHVQACDRCRTEVEVLADMRARISALPALSAPEQAWSEIMARMDKTGQVRARRYVLMAGIAVAASVLIAMSMWIFQKTQQQPVVSLATASAPGPSVPKLVGQSRSLENTVLSLSASADHMVISAGTAATVAALEDRIALVDYQINTASVHAANEPELVQLWQQRVDLLQSLAAVRYAQLASNGI